MKSQKPTREQEDIKSTTDLDFKIKINSIINDFVLIERAKWNKLGFKQGQLSKEEEIYDIFKRNGYKNMKAWLKQQIQGGKE